MSVSRFIHHDPCLPQNVNVLEQEKVDQLMLDMDGTENKCKPQYCYKTLCLNTFCILLIQKNGQHVNMQRLQRVHL